MFLDEVYNRFNWNGSEKCSNIIGQYALIFCWLNAFYTFDEVLGVLDIVGRPTY